jgi:hypothetical protein
MEDAVDIPLDSDLPLEDAVAPSMVIINNQHHVTHGMEVVGADGGAIGVLKEIDGQSILVDRPWHRDVYVPFEAIRDVVRGQLVLTIPADQVDSMDWPKPRLV